VSSILSAESEGLVLTTENDFIRQLASRFPVRPPVEVGIGDDGAVIHDPSAERIVVVTDLLLDGVHFDLRQTSAQLAGRKAIAVNLSDLAAMACQPTAAFVSIALPRARNSSTELFLQELYSGIEELTNEYRFTLAGGDTNSWAGPFAINVCLTGRPMRERPVLRSGARPDDVLFVSGPLGGSLRRGRHLTFRPRLDAAEWLINQVRIHAMMDISDGLSMDLHRMMEASRASAVLNSEWIPIHSDVPEEAPSDLRLSAALSDGEDFELLLSVPPDEARGLREKAAAAGFEFFEIGSVTEGLQSHIRDRNGQLSPLEVTGWQHELQ
jgi:thiamine-monophosphate kinase